jgi:tetratricopeptide (TPR) repeat protein
MVSSWLRAAGCAVPLISLISLAPLGRVAAAQPARLAQEFQQGVDAYRLGEYAQARAHLEKARDLNPKLPGPYRFLAAVARAEKRFDDCIAHAAQALQVAPQSREAADTRKLHEDCRVEDGRPAFTGEFGEGGAIVITALDRGAPITAPVFIDGKASGSAPLSPRPIPAGRHEIRVSSSKPREVTAAVTIVAGIVTDLEVELSAAAAVEPGWLELPASVVGQANLQLTIDGRVTEPATRITLPPGTHSVQVSRRGRRPWASSVEVTAGKATKVAPVLRDKGGGVKKAR